MKHFFITHLTIVTICTFGIQFSSAQVCANGDFEAGNMNAWGPWTGTALNGGHVTMGQKSSRQEIVSGATMDPYGNFPMVNPAGGSYSVRLGNDSAGAQAEVMEQKFAVTAGGSNFKYSYAVVQETAGHDSSNSAKLVIGIYDMNGLPVPGSLTVEYITAGIPAGYTAFNNGICPGHFGCMAKTGVMGAYKPWSNVCVDLSAYIGQDVTIKFETRDCGTGGHFGYAYIDADCMPAPCGMAIAELNQDIEVHLFPNPTHDFLEVMINADKPMISATFELTDELGRKVYSALLPGSKLSVNTSSLARGIYYYQVVTEGVTAAKGKIILQ